MPNDATLAAVEKAAEALALLSKADARRILAASRKALKQMERELRRVAAITGSSARSVETRTVMASLNAIVRAGILNQTRAEYEVVAIDAVKATNIGTRSLVAQIDTFDVPENVAQVFARLQSAIPTAAELMTTAGLQRFYGEAIVAKSGSRIRAASKILSDATLTSEKMSETISKLGDSLALKPYEAERLARTEMSRASHQTQLISAQGVGGMFKTLIGVRDNRTGKDSIIIESDPRNQAVPLDGNFVNDSGVGLSSFPYPPNRPNDRATIAYVPDPRLLKPMSDDDLNALLG